MNNVETERSLMRNKFADKLPDEYYANRLNNDKRVLTQKIRTMNFNGKLILEIGAGCGYLGRICKQNGGAVILSDIYGEQFPDGFGGVIMDNALAAFRGGIFDYIFCDNVLHHGGLRDTINEIYRILKSGGTFMAVCEPCISSANSETEILQRDCSAELQLGIVEHRPNHNEYLKCFAAFSFVEIIDAVTAEYRGDSDYGGNGCAIHAEK
jgi:SAM-dependent methyltransferase